MYLFLFSPAINIKKRKRSGCGECNTMQKNGFFTNFVELHWNEYYLNGCTHGLQMV